MDVLGMAGVSGVQGGTMVLGGLVLLSECRRTGREAVNLRSSMKSLPLLRQTTRRCTRLAGRDREARTRAAVCRWAG